MHWCWNNIPFTPRRCPFFYGWVIVGASTVGIIASIPGQTMGVGVFADDLLVVLDLSRVQLSTAYMLGTIGSSLLLPLAGSLMDRVGLRVMLTVSSLGLGLSMMLLSQCDRILALRAEASLGWSLAVAMGCFLFMRFFGQGCLTMASRVAIGKWFNHRRGLATGISGIFVAFGFNSSPMLLNALVQTYGWRQACFMLAIVVGAGMSVVGWILYRDDPESCGLVMDGVEDEAWQQKMARRVPDVRRDYTRGDVARNYTFWVFNLALGSQALIITAIVFHIASLGAEQGLTRTAAFAVFLPMSSFSVAANFLAGWLSDRIRLKWLLVAMMVCQAMGSVGLLTLGDRTGTALFVAGYGISGGLFATITTVTWPRFFGRRYLGAVSGLSMSVMVFASAVGPVLFSTGQRWTGTYRHVVALSLLMPLVLIGCGFKADNPQESEPVVTGAGSRPGAGQA